MIINDINGLSDNYRSFCLFVFIYLRLDLLTHICLLELERFTMCMSHWSDVFSMQAKAVQSQSQGDVPEVESKTNSVSHLHP